MKRLTEEEEKEEMYAVSTETHDKTQSEQKSQANGKNKQYMSIGLNDGRISGLVGRISYANINCQQVQKKQKTWYDWKARQLKLSSLMFYRTARRSYIANGKDLWRWSARLDNSTMKLPWLLKDRVPKHNWGIQFFLMKSTKWRRNH